MGRRRGLVQQGIYGEDGEGGEGKDNGGGELSRGASLPCPTD